MKKATITVYFKEQTSIFFIGNDVNEIIVLSNENKFSSFDKFTQCLPKFIIPILVEYS
ncbi:hypothetical protein ACQKMD_15795 [Viridibacillus sp. NPDC096237]|uniref:hypothetical protein n=1 Tax=Viridibacillus sp. NPDC096237 TaxID=3390721 RepID=UPI003CFDC31A